MFSSLMHDILCTTLVITRGIYPGSYNGMHVSHFMARTVLLREPGRHTLVWDS
jgi:hypothetical protein